MSNLWNHSHAFWAENMREATRSQREVPTRMNTDTKPSRLLTPADLEEIIGKPREWVLRYVPHKVHIGHRTVRWFAEDVQQWLESFRLAS